MNIQQNFTLSSRKTASYGFLVFSLLFIGLSLQSAIAAPRVATYASLNYDVVYVRCPRAKEPVRWSFMTEDKLLLNWGGVNDIWLSAANNIYQQPGCDLVLHHSDPAYKGGLAMGDRGREEVLVNCDEGNTSQPICTIADPNVSFDGKLIVYTKFMDTRTVMSGSGSGFGAAINIAGDGGWGPGPIHLQSVANLYPAGDNPKGGAPFGQRSGSSPRPYDAPALIFTYNLETGVETQISPDERMWAGRAYPGKSIDWTTNMPVMDTGPFFRADGRIGFTSNRNNGAYRFQLFAMDLDGRNLELHGHRAMNQQLHPASLKDGRIVYTSFDMMLQKVHNNNYSLFTINPDSSFPFILAGKFDPTQESWHFVTQLSDGDVVSTLYYNKNNSGMGILRRFPIDPVGADFENLGAVDGIWREGTRLRPFNRREIIDLTPKAHARDAEMAVYASADDYWIHPSRVTGGTSKVIKDIDGTAYDTVIVDKAIITMQGRFTHPSGAPDNDLLVTYTIGSSSTMGSYSGADLQTVLDKIGKDAGIWHIALEPNSSRQVGHIADDAQIVVDFPEYHEIMARAVVPYRAIYGITHPGIDETGSTTQYARGHENMGLEDPRLPAGSPFALSGASSLYDRETRAMNGIPWNMKDGGGTMSGRTYTNLASDGADLAIYDNDEVYGIRVMIPVPGIPLGYSGGIEQWAGVQKHHLRILGEFPVRKADGSLLDDQGNPDTSFMVKLPADTPFLFQSLDKRGMALDIETTSRSMIRGEQQLCIGCHVHTREGMDPYSSVAKLDTAAPFGDFSGDSAPLMTVDDKGNPDVRNARSIYGAMLPVGATSRRSFSVDWVNGVADVIGKRCASCHAEGKPAQQLTGLRLDGDSRTYDLLIRNAYKREDGERINYNTLPGDGLNDVLNETLGTDRITRNWSCCLSSRWVARNSARSSMLIWALYGERLDGRNPSTGLPWGAAGESVPASVPAGLRNVPVDNFVPMREHPEVWPRVAEHADYVADMPEVEKRLIARWLDLGAPKLNAHDDTMRPVLTVTPILQGGGVSQVYVGLWDDSPLDYNSFLVTRNGKKITPTITGTPDTVTVDLGTTVTESNADSVSFTFEILDKPDRTLSLVKPGVPAANRTRKTITGRSLLRMVDVTPNAPPSAVGASLMAYSGASSEATLAVVSDPDTGDSHFISIVSKPSQGTAAVVNNRLVYTAADGFVGMDSFAIRATDMGGLSVTGTANVKVLAPVVGQAPSPVVLPPDPVSGPSNPSSTNSSSGLGGGGAIHPLTVLLGLLAWLVFLGNHTTAKKSCKVASSRRTRFGLGNGVRKIIT